MKHKIGFLMIVVTLTLIVFTMAVSANSRQYPVAVYMQGDTEYAYEEQPADINTHSKVMEADNYAPEKYGEEFPEPSTKMKAVIIGLSIMGVVTSGKHVKDLLK